MQKDKQLLYSVYRAFSILKLLIRISASEYNILDPYENGRGTALSDVLYRGQLDIISGNWDGELHFKKPKIIIHNDYDFLVISRLTLKQMVLELALL